MSLDLSVYLVTDSAQAHAQNRSLAEIVSEAVAGGVTCVQLREKGASVEHVCAQASAIAAILPAHVTLLINDNIDAFLRLRAAGIAVHGVHVGQSDTPVEQVRELIGPTAILGLSAATPAQIRAATASSAHISYLGIGAVHHTDSKLDAPAAIGIRRVGELAALTPLPAVAIGGIGVADVASLRRAGVAGVAVVSLICASASPRSVAAELSAHWHGARARVVPTVLTIAGTDPTGGAGVQADLKSIAAQGGYALSVITALVAQNTLGVHSVHTPPAAFLREQLRAVSEDVRIDAVKIGMLGDLPTIAAVREWVTQYRPGYVVLDPVMIASSGDRLLDASAEQALRDLLPLADLITPNIPELAVLAQAKTATSWQEALDQAAALAQRYGVRVLAKGGHLGGELTTVPDALVEYHGEALTVTEFRSPRVLTPNTHGTGCSLSSALATLRPQSTDWEQALERAKAWLTESLRHGEELDIGRGHGPIHHLHALWSGGISAPPAGPRPSAPEIARSWWERIEPTRTEVDNLRFVQGLAAGSLDRGGFTSYLAQDALYLRDYARVLSEASRIAPDAAEQAFWAASAHGSLAAEIELHTSWLPEGETFAATAIPATTAYVDHLLATAARGDYRIMIAAVLPCFWMYVDLGTRLGPLATPDHPYRSWLEQYADPGFATLTEEAIRIVTEHAVTAPPEIQEAMWEAFRVSAQHERDFFAAHA